MNLLITGGAGFIGSNMIQYLLNKYDHYTIINLDKLGYAGSLHNMNLFINHPRHIFVQGDITDKSLVENVMKQYDVEGIIHFAAESHVDNSIASPEPFIYSNIVGTFTLLEAARKLWKEDQNKRFHHISTDEVYGSLEDEGEFTELTAFSPNSPYSASKASSDHLVRAYHKTYGLNTVISNCSNNYGPRQHDEKLIPTIIRRALSLQGVPIYGNGKNVRDWLYVEDHCDAIDTLFHRAPMGEHFNIGGEQEVANIDLAKMILDCLDILVPAQNSYHSLIEFVNDRPGHDFRYAVSNNKIKSNLGWIPKTTFADGLNKTLQYYVHKVQQLECVA